MLDILEKRCDFFYYLRIFERETGEIQNDVILGYEGTPLTDTG